MTKFSIFFFLLCSSFVVLLLLRQCDPSLPPFRNVFFQIYVLFSFCFSILFRNGRLSGRVHFCWHISLLRWVHEKGNLTSPLLRTQTYTKPQPNSDAQGFPIPSCRVSRMTKFLSTYFYTFQYTFIIPVYTDIHPNIYIAGPARFLTVIHRE